MRPSSFVALLLSASFAASAGPILYDVALNTSTISGTAGSIDFNFSPGGSSQAASLQILDFTSDGTLAGNCPCGIGDVAGQLPATLAFDNGTAFNDYFDQFQFGNTISFEVSLFGPALSAPDGTSTSGSTFAFSMFFDPAGTFPVLTRDTTDGFAFTIDVNLDGTTTVTNYTTGTITPESSAPEPGSLILSGTALAACVALHLRRRTLNLDPHPIRLPVTRRAYNLSMFQIQRSAPVADVVIIGSGAGGGTATKVLVDLGLHVTLLEAGPMLHPETDFKEHKWPYDYSHRGAGEGGASYFGHGRDFGWFSAHAGGWQLEGEPYTVAQGSQFRWFRSRIVGGRTNHYGRISLRYADYDLKPYSRDGIGTDWPITYDEIAPYYDKAEKFIGVTGSREGIRSAPDGQFQPCPPPRVHEVLIQKASQRLGIPCIPNRLAVITQPTNGRAACHYCGECGRGCISASNYSSAQVQVFPAMKTGRVNLITNAMARELITDSEGKVTAISYIDKTTRTEKQVKCRAVILAASCCESTRLLLNSKAPRHANGLGNSSGVVGRYLTDNTGFGLGASIPALHGLQRYNVSDGMGGAHLYMPWWLWDKKTDFPRGYHIEIGGGYGMPGIGTFAGLANREEGYGDALKKKIYEDYGTHVSFAGRGEMIPNADTYCEIDNNVVDRWGIPVLKFHFKWTDAELKQVAHMEQTFTSIIETMGGKVTASTRPLDQKISTGGEIIHEVGSIRMGDDPKTSAVNKYCQSHDVKNVFVADAAPFVSNPDKNPTLTICALAWRTAEYMAEEMRKGNV